MSLDGTIMEFSVCLKTNIFKVLQPFLIIDRRIPASVEVGSTGFPMVQELVHQQYELTKIHPPHAEGYLRSDPKTCIRPRV